MLIHSESEISMVHDPANFIHTIYIEESCRDLPYVQEMIQKAGKVSIKTVAEQDFSRLQSGGYVKGLSKGKRNLLLTRNKGKFLKPCPATREYRCCDYQVLNIGMNCPMDCVYCILQAYLNNPWLSFFVNVEDLISELEEAFAREPDRIWRIGTGEFTDSLALDNLTGLSAKLVNFMALRKNSILELKTKTANIENLNNLDHGGNTIVSWSLNSPHIMAQEELHTASLQDRLAAASKCAEWGYKIAFHFDPIIYHDNWQQGYAATISQLFDQVPAENIAWISMGALRFLPPLKNIVKDRFPNCKIFYEEFIEGLDGKSRYFRSQRVELYQSVYGELVKHVSPKTCVYLCMESDEIWKEVFGYNPEQQGGLPAMLDKTVT